MSGWEISEEAVRRRSYLLWEREGRQPDRDKEYWHRAEAELRAEYQAALEGRTTRIVLPRLVISRRPIMAGDAEHAIENIAGEAADRPRRVSRTTGMEHDEAA